MVVFELIKRKFQNVSYLASGFIGWKMVNPKLYNKYSLHKKGID